MISKLSIFSIRFAVCASGCSGMDGTNPRTQTNIHVNMFSRFSPRPPPSLTRIPVFRCQERRPVGAAVRLVGGVIDSGEGTPRVSRESDCTNGSSRGPEQTRLWQRKILYFRSSGQTLFINNYSSASGHCRTCGCLKLWSANTSSSTSV